MWGHLGNVQVTKGQLSQMSLLLIEKNAQVGWGSAGGKREIILGNGKDLKFRLSLGSHWMVSSGAVRIDTNLFSSSHILCEGKNISQISGLAIYLFAL